MDTRVVYLEPSKITIDTVTLPDLKPNQVLVKTHQASVCGSERYFYRGINVRPQDEARAGPGTQLAAPVEAGGADSIQAAFSRSTICRKRSSLPSKCE